MIIVVFRSRLKTGIDESELTSLGKQMYELASHMPGFISYKEFAAADGEGVAIVEFESNETLEAWRNHPEHRKAQERGRQEFFDDYRIVVCSPIRDYGLRSGA